MDELSSFIGNLRGDIRALIQNDAKATGFDYDTILLQSTFMHYQSVFQELNADLHYFVIFNESENRYYEKVINYLDLNSFHELLCYLFEIDVPNRPIRCEFPPLDEVYNVLTYDINFEEFSDEERLETYFEFLILSYHVSIQPGYIIFPALRGEQPFFSSYMVDLPFEQAKIIGSKSKRSYHVVRKIEHEIKKRIWNIYQQIVDIENKL